jgi:hypothetical protein
VLCGGAMLIALVAVRLARHAGVIQGQEWWSGRPWVRYAAGENSSYACITVVARSRPVGNG